MSKIKIFAILLLSAVFLVCMFGYVSMREHFYDGNVTIPVRIGNQVFQFEVVSTEQKMQKGLGDRDGMCDQCGMLFEFEKASRYSFWMKDMRFPLDIVWVYQGKIVYIEKNVQPSFTGILTPKEDADAVLEVNAGIMDRLGMKVGDKLSF